MDELTRHIINRKVTGIAPGVWEAIDERFLALGASLAAQAGAIEDLKSPPRIEGSVVAEGKYARPSLLDVLLEIRDLLYRAHAKPKRRR